MFRPASSLLIRTRRSLRREVSRRDITWNFFFRMRGGFRLTGRLVVAFRSLLCLVVRTRRGLRSIGLGLIVGGAPSHRVSRVGRDGWSDWSFFRHDARRKSDEGNRGG